MRNRVISGVYKITTDKMSYIGESDNIFQRLTQHFSCKMDTIDTKLLQLDLQTANWENYKIEILKSEILKKEDLKTEEDKLIKKHNTLYPNGYNLHTDDTLSPFKKWILIDEYYSIIAEEDSNNRNLFYENVKLLLEGKTSRRAKKKVVLKKMYIPKQYLDYMEKYNHLRSVPGIQYFFDYYTLNKLLVFEETKENISLETRFKLLNFFDYFEKMDILDKTNLQLTLAGKNITFDKKVIVNFKKGIQSFSDVNRDNVSLMEYLEGIIDKINLASDPIIKNLYYEVFIKPIKKDYFEYVQKDLVKRRKRIPFEIGTYYDDTNQLIVIRKANLPQLAKDLKENLEKSKSKKIEAKLYVIDEATILISLPLNTLVNPLVEIDRIIKTILEKGNLDVNFIKDKIEIKTNKKYAIINNIFGEEVKVPIFED